jgi:hypothetical protein
LLRKRAIIVLHIKTEKENVTSAVLSGVTAQKIKKFHRNTEQTTAVRRLG